MPSEPSVTRFYVAVLAAMGPMHHGDRLSPQGQVLPGQHLPDHRFDVVRELLATPPPGAADPRRGAGGQPPAPPAFEGLNLLSLAAARVIIAVTGCAWPPRRPWDVSLCWVRGAVGAG